MKKIIKLTNQESIKIYHKIVKLVKTAEPRFFRFKKLKGVMGYCEWENGIILDYRRELFSTLIHECIHYMYPEWNESQVLYAEKRVVNSINSKQVIKLLKVFVLQLP